MDFVVYYTIRTSVRTPLASRNNPPITRSSLFIGLRLCWHLGYRNVMLLGCDASGGQHPAPMYWPTILYLIEQIAPTFKRFNYNVYQTNPDSHLRSFEFRDFRDFAKVMQ